MSSDSWPAARRARRRGDPGRIGPEPYVAPDAFAPTAWSAGTPRRTPRQGWPGALSADPAPLRTYGERALAPRVPLRRGNA
eukprot:4512466-Lingulodinium_polyedra.AAC.1